MKEKLLKILLVTVLPTAFGAVGTWLAVNQPYAYESLCAQQAIYPGIN
ncbi:hypothetical protein [Pararhodobacter sp.]